MRAILAQIEAEALKFLDRLGRALDEKRSGFSDYEAGDFLASGALLGRFESDGPDAADVFSAAGDAAEAGSAPVEPAPRAPGADPRWIVRTWLSDPAVLLRRAADHLDSSACALDALVPDTGHRLVADPLIAGLRDLAAQFDADEQPAT